MNSDLQNARRLLQTGNYTCVLCRDGHTLTATERGVRPLMDLLPAGPLSGYSAADKVVGKATAFLYVLLDVRAVYAPVMSTSAIEVLSRHGITALYDTAVPAIFNRDRSGYCPMETAVRALTDPREARRTIEATLASGIHRK